jgi:F0F1-type ATP synthase gamma subunit
MTNGNDSAFQNKKEVIAGCVTQTVVCQSLTKREYFAAMAMQGLIACQAFDAISYKAAMTEAVKNADALIQALNEEPK